ncbi:uncharacterized protein [Montipora capricornis]|uniref:uncharacterized protein isoform X6 n=1 Tax=Montipora capricornis TaxID=246305 RepID=UPI0035F1EAC2
MRDFRAMAPSSWIRCVISSFFLYTTLPYHAEGFKKTTQCDGDWHCTGPDEKLYNLAPLQKEGEPRFPKARKKGSHYYFAYNPCGSFKLGSSGDCSGDVAICMWTLTETYQNVGIHKTSTFTIIQGTNGSSTGFIEYRNERTFNEWTNIVYLVCDRNRKSANSASFRVITEDNGKSQRVLCKYCNNNQLVNMMHERCGSTQDEHNHHLGYSYCRDSWMYVHHGRRHVGYHCLFEGLPLLGCFLTQQQVK